MEGFRSRYDNKIVFNVTMGWPDRPVTVPCGQCVGCRLERSRQWAMRCMHEAQLHDDNCFITLTYNNENLPEDGSLKIEHFQKFMKRLRKKYTGKTIRFYHCGEYGEKFFRPHYHAIIFGLEFADKKLFKTQNDIKLFTSETLSKLWPYGFATVGSVTFESAAYCARYVMKKINGKQKKSHYERVNQETGEIIDLKPEYNTMSRNPGIARDWYKQFKDDVYPSDFITLRGKKMKPPKFYDNIYEHELPKEFEKLKKKRMQLMQKHKADNTPERLEVKEKVKKAQLKSLKRPIEES